MNLLTYGFMNNCGRLFGPSDRCEAEIVEGLGICVRSVDGYAHPTLAMVTVAALM